jgi:hypothetical protein
MLQAEGSILDHGRQVKTGMVVHGSILLLAISILGFAYLFWESYLVTKR